MIDVILLALPIFLGWAINYSVLEPLYGIEEQRFNHLLSGGVDPRRIRPREVPALQDLEHFEWVWDDVAPCAEEAKLWAEVQGEAKRDRLGMAKRALESIPDVSCDSVAEALQLPKLTVRRLSTRARRKGREVTEYSAEEVLVAAGTPSEQVVWN